MTSSISLSVSRPFMGLFLSFLAVLFGLVTGILIKKTSPDIGIVTTLFYRFLFSIPLLCAYALYLRGRQFLQINQTKTLALRIIIGGSGIVFWFLSLRNMPLGQATALFQSAVIFVTFFSPLLLGEKIGIYRWSAVIAGLFGVFIVTDPFHGDVSIYALFGICAAMSGAALSIVLRRLGRGDSPASVALWHNGTGTIVTAIIVISMPHLLDPIDRELLFNLILLGVIASGLQICFTSAYRYADAVVVSSMRYLQIPLSGLAGYLIFAEVMNLTQILGVVIIISSCLVIAWREFVRNRETTLAPE
ncbi:DMT family transporter [Alphaproteobacteria bacterium]|nr:DMT family transporter [Alphaproteobacteria bacterium]